MSKFVTFLMMVLVLGFALTLPAQALNIGGHDETSEVNLGRWANGVPSPGVAPALVGIHLLISEFAVTGTPVEFIEIYNPTAELVDLSQYYLSDAWYEPAAPAPIEGYFLLPTGTYTITTNTDFCVRFPSGASIAPGNAIVVAVDGTGIDAAYGPGTADFEIENSSPNIPDMINVGNNNPAIVYPQALLTNTAEPLVLFFWGGLLDNVCDIDYVTWGPAGTTTRVDKTGQSIDGPDPDALPTPYKNDTPDANQSAIVAPNANNTSAARVLLPEGAETNPGGNGCCMVPPTAVEYSTWGKVKALYR